MKYSKLGRSDVEVSRICLGITDFVFQFGLTAFSIGVAEFVPAFVTTTVNGAAFAPILLYAYARWTTKRAPRS